MSNTAIRAGCHGMPTCAVGIMGNTERKEMLVERGEPAARIVEVARQKEADLIVMGARNTRNLAATHLEIGTVHSVVAQAPCPVLTVRPKNRQAA